MLIVAMLYALQLAGRIHGFESVNWKRLATSCPAGLLPIRASVICSASLGKVAGARPPFLASSKGEKGGRSWVARPGSRYSITVLAMKKPRCAIDLGTPEREIGKSEVGTECQ